MVSAQPAGSFHSGINFRGTNVATTVLEISCRDLSAIKSALNNWSKDQSMDTELLPVSICFKLSPLPESHFVADCLSIIRAHKLLPFAVHSDNQSFIDLCHQLGLADLPEKPFKAKPQRTTVKQRPLVVTKPVRSGQQVYAQNRDLVVMAPVSNGAEVMADGSIYLYDTLRGRAMAGVKGDSSASIVCKKLEAELIAIAGIYMLNEQFSQHAQEIIAYIDDDTLIVDTIKD